MQRKTIQNTIKTKLESWLESITDENLRKEVRNNVVVSGGSICSLFLGENVNDYDVYIKSEDVCLKLTKYYTKGFPELEVISYKQKENLGGHGIRGVIIDNLKEGQVKILMPQSPSGTRTSFEDKGLNKFLPLFFSPNAISLSDKLQIVLRFTGSVDEIHKSFDFIHATNYFTFEDGLVTNLKALESILSKQLYYQGSFYPLTTIIRMKKFIKRGWNVNAGEMLKVMFQISQLDLTNLNTLEEQIIGVDVGYFGKLVEILKGKAETDPSFTLNYGYLCTLIDKIFSENED